MGFGAVGPIPHSAIAAEALRLGLGDDGLHELWYIIHKLDDQERAAINKPPSDKPGASGGGLSHKDRGGSVRRGKRKSEGNHSS